MENLMMFHCSNKKRNKIVTAFFVFGLCLVLAFSVIAPPIAYANEINQMFEAFAPVISMCAGTMVTYGLCAAAGITTVAAATASIYAFLALICALGIGILVSSFVNLLLSEESLNMLGVDFWKALSTCWDNTKMRFVCAASVFTGLVEQVKVFFGVSPDTYLTDFPYMEYDVMPEDKKTEFGLVGNSDSYHFNYDKYILEYIGNKSSNYTEASIGDDITMSLSVPDNLFTVNFNGNLLTTSIGYDSYVVHSFGVTKPIVIDDQLYFCTSKVMGFNTLFYWSQNSKIKLNDKNLYYSSSKGIYDNKYTTGNYYYCCKSDGSFVFPTSIANFLYLIFVKDYSIITSAEKITVSDTSELTDEDTSVLGNLSGTIANGINSTVIGKYAKESTYDKDKDIVSGLAGAIGSSATGDVTITAAEVPNVKVDENTDVSSAVTITDVTANDVVNTETGTEVMLDAQTAWVTGLNTLKIASAGISNKFPFCIPSYLSEQLNILVGEEKEPIFVIPFQIQSANINESITIDLTKFDKLLAVTDFFLVAILVVGLAFSTKKLLF